MTDNLPFTQVWQNRKGVDLDLSEVNPFSPITPENVEYLINKYSFLQLINPIALFAEEIVPEFVTAQSGWTIHDYGDALASSPGEYLYGGADYATINKQFLHQLESNKEGEAGGDDGDGGDGLPVINPGKGTIIKQAYDTAYDMIALAIEREWKGIKLVDGSPFMKWAGWAISKNRGLSVEGYDPTEKDEERRERAYLIRSIADDTPVYDL